MFGFCQKEPNSLRLIQGRNINWEIVILLFATHLGVLPCSPIRNLLLFLL